MQMGACATCGHSALHERACSPMDQSRSYQRQVLSAGCFESYGRIVPAPEANLS